MNLKNGQITVSEITRDPRAYALLNREFAQIAQSPLFRLAGGMTLQQVLSFAKGTAMQEKLDSLLKQLEAL